MGAEIPERFHEIEINELYTSCADPEGRGQEVRTPPPHLKNHKNIGFLTNNGPDPLRNY